MNSVTYPEYAWNLYRAGMAIEAIAEKLVVHRATLFHWFKGIRLYGIREFLRRYKVAKQRKRVRRIDPRVEPLLIERRRAKEECGQKLRYWLRKVHGIVVSVATIYRILAKHFKLRSKWKRWTRRPALPKATRAREVIQVDTVDLGELFAQTAIDTFTREVVVTILPSLTSTDAAAGIRRAMATFGTTVWIQTDNGPEYKGHFRPAAREFCQSVRQITPYQKDENAFIESFNRTLRKECVGWRHYKRHEQHRLQQYVNTFLTEYHTERPHLGINMLTPQEFVESHLP